MKNHIAYAVAAVLALGIAGSASAQTVNSFKFSTGINAFTFDGSWYGVTLTGNPTGDADTTPRQDIGPGKTVNLVTLLPTTNHKYYYNNDPTNSYTYAFYRQPNSVVIANLETGDATNYFIKDIVGNNTPISALPTSGSYTYNGQTLWHHVDNEGTFTYTINLATRQGSGRVEDLEFNWGGIPLSVEGNLAAATITTQSDGTLGVKNAAVTNFTTGNGFIDLLYLTGVNPKYDLAVFGPNAEEVAGRVIINDQFGSFGIAGTR